MNKRQLYIALAVFMGLLAGSSAFCQSFPSWEKMGLEILDRFNKGAMPDQNIKTSAENAVRSGRTDGEKADLIAEFLKINIIDSKGQSNVLAKTPQSAQSTYNTKSGNWTDKAILAKALFESAGLKANPIFFSKTFGPVDTSIVSLDWFGPVTVWISGTDFEAVYDPITDRVTTGLRSLFGKTVWMPGYDPVPVQRMPGDKEASLFRIIIDLKYDRENEMIIGSGMITASNCLCPFGQMHGLKNESFDYLVELTDDILPGSKLTGYNPTRFDYFTVTTGYEFEMDYPKDGKIRIGRPGAGLLSVINGMKDDLESGNDLYLQCLVNEEIEIRFDNQSFDSVDLPKPFNFTNSIGELSLNIKDDIDRQIIMLTSNLIHVNVKSDEFDEIKQYLKNLKDHELIKIGIKTSNNQ